MKTRRFTTCWVVTDPSHTMAPVYRTFPSFTACSAPSCFCRAIQGVAGKRPIFSQPALFIDVPMFCMGPPVLYGHFWLQGRQQLLLSLSVRLSGVTT